MTTLPAPGLVWGIYPERRDARRLADRRLGSARYRRLVIAAKRQGTYWRSLAPADLAAAGAELRRGFGRDGLTPYWIAGALAAAGESVRRSLGLTVYDSQLFAAAVILDNRLAEMATGEGKTLAALLAAATGALAGMPVHVLTANDYLVGRDAAHLAPTYALLGLSVGAVTHDMDEAARRQAYACDVTYVTAKELVFDYLRDGLRHGARHSELERRAGALARPSAPTLLRGLCMAILDEADSLLIDDAQTPLVLSRQADDPAGRAFHWQAAMLAGRLSKGRDFRLDPDNGQPRLTEAGRDYLASLAAPLGGHWRSPRLGEDAVLLALAARHTYQRDRDYLVRDGRIEMIDAATGRVAPGRVWSRGLHALIEHKEGCQPGPVARTLAQITYQRFFPRYLRLGGMSGTLAEAAGELKDIYGLRIVRVPLRTPSARQRLPSRLFADQAALWQAVGERIRGLQSAGRPVLVGTASVAESEALAARLDALGIAHQVLNARHDEEEARIVGRAGLPGMVTITTNMAGRGTDIPLGPGVAEAGGLHVLCCQHNASRRIDRQLRGRCARQGDPGSCETWLAIDAGAVGTPPFVGWLGRRRGNGELALPPGLVGLWLGWRQWQASERLRLGRRQMFLADLAWEEGMSFTGRGE